MLETDRLILRHWCEADADALFKYASDSEVGPTAGWAPHTSSHQSLEIIKTVFDSPEIYAVVLKDTNEVVGCCGIVLPGDNAPEYLKPGEAEIGYWLGRPFWGKGLIPEAVNKLIDRSFTALDLQTLWCVYYEGNHKSRRVCEKCGFHFHHKERGVLTPLGDIRDENYCILSRECTLKNLIKGSWLMSRM